MVWKQRVKTLAFPLLSLFVRQRGMEVFYEFFYVVMAVSYAGGLFSRAMLFC